MSQAPSILLIDDNEQIRQVARDLLRQEFPHCLIHEIDSLNGLQQALETGGFNLAITDYQLGWTDGLAVLLEVKSRYPDCPVVMFTGTGSEEIAVEAMKAGLDDYVLKSSAHIGRLVASVRTALAQAEERRMARRTEARNRSLISDVLETSAVGLFILDAEFRVVWINAALERYFGLRRADVLGHDKRQLIQEVIRFIFDQPMDFAERVLQSYVDNRWEESFECHVQPGGGREERWLEHRSMPIHTGLYTGGRIEHYYDITERKQTEQVLATSEQRYRIMFERNPYPMWVYDVESLAILAVNDAAVAHYGYAKDEWLTMTIKEIRPLEDVPALLAHLARVHTGPDWTGLSRHRKKDGTLIDVDIISHALEYSGQRAQLVLAWDVTERQRAERALQAAKDYAENLIQTANVIVVELDQIGRIKVFNKTAEDVTGYSFTELDGRNWFETVVPRERYPYVYEVFQTLTAGGLPKHLENPILTKHGKERHIMWQNNEVREQGHIVGSVSFGIDITDRIEAEEALRESERNLAEAQRLAKIGSWSFDLVGNRVTWSDELYRIYGISKSDCVGSYEAVLSRVHPDDQRLLAQTNQQARTEGQPFDIEYRILLPNKELKTVREVGYASRDAEGKIVRLFGTAQDVTERKQMERHAGRIERLAALGQMLGGIAHELKNPLFILTGRMQLLKAKLAARNDDALSSDMEKIEAAAVRMTHITERFLTLAKPAQLQQTQCDIRAILNETLEFLSNELMKNQIRFIVEVSPDLPAIRSNPHQLQEVFLNLLLNALQAMAKAHGHGTLTVRAKLSAVEGTPSTSAQGRKPQWIEVRIQDDGPGILPEYQARLFEPFFSTKPAQEGTGLGLWTVRSIVLSLNGEVTYETEVGRGTTFIIRLPTLENRDSDPRRS